MSLVAFASCVLFMLGLLSLPPILFARKRSLLFMADGALLVVPGVLFVAALALLNEPAQTGLAIIIYPFLCVALCVSLLWIRVFVLCHLPVPSHSLSLYVLAAACIAAATVGALVPPLYE